MGRIQHPFLIMTPRLEIQMKAEAEKLEFPLWSVGLHVFSAHIILDVEFTTVKFQAR